MLKPVFVSMKGKLMRMKTMSIWVVLLTLLLLPFAAQAHDEGGECDLVYLFNGWARATPEGAPNGAVFGFLVNLTGTADRLISASTDVAEVVEFHETVIGDGDVMQMRPLEDGFAVEANHFLQLQPGGLHIMLINLRQPLEAGSTFELVLNFEHAGAVSLSVPVREMVEMGAGMGESEEHVMSMPAPEAAWSDACAKMYVVEGWARPAAAAMPNSAAYGLLLNLTDSDDTLISANSSVAQAVELHEMLMGEGDVMQMRPIEGGITVASGAGTLLQPGGLHIMLIGLNQELEAGTTLELTLEFAESGTLELTVPIHEPGEAEMPMGGM